MTDAEIAAKVFNAIEERQPAFQIFEVVLEALDNARKNANDAAYQCIIDATRAFAPPTDGKDVSAWFDKHQATIDAVLEWKNKQ